MPENIEEAAKKLAHIHYESGSTSAVYWALDPVGTQNEEEECIKLLEVNDDTIPSGIVPLRFGPLPESGVSYGSTIIEVTSPEYEQIDKGQLQLPPGWEARTYIPPADESTIPGQ